MREEIFLATCSRCGRERPSSLFYQSSTRPSGVRAECISCSKATQRDRRAAETKKKLTENRVDETAAKLAEIWDLDSRVSPDAASTKAIGYAIRAGWLEPAGECACSCGARAKRYIVKDTSPGMRISSAVARCSECLRAEVNGDEMSRDETSPSPQLRKV